MKIYFRGDGHHKMGLGHVVRSLALAQMLKGQYQLIFLIRNPIATLYKQIEEVCDSIIVLPAPESDTIEAKKIAAEFLTPNDTMVLDGYHFDTTYQRMIKESGCQLVAIDDIHAHPFVADIVLNHALGISTEDYQLAPDTQLLLGTRYTLLRPEILETDRRRDTLSEASPLLLCMGGADPNNDTVAILDMLDRQAIQRPIVLLVGAAYTYEKELINWLSNHSLKVEWHRDVPAKQLVELMKRCPIAILPPSTIAYEYLHIGGLLFLTVIATNQKRMFESFIANQLAYDFKAFDEIQLDLSPAKWKALLARQATYFDGQQQARFKTLFEELTATIIA